MLRKKEWQKATMKRSGQSKEGNRNEREKKLGRGDVWVGIRSLKIRKWEEQNQQLRKSSKQNQKWLSMKNVF